MLALGLHDGVRGSIFCRRGLWLGSAWWFGRKVPFVLGGMLVWTTTTTGWVHVLVVFSL